MPNDLKDLTRDEFDETLTMLRLLETNVSHLQASILGIKRAQIKPAPTEMLLNVAAELCARVYMHMKQLDDNKLIQILKEY